MPAADGKTMNRIQIRLAAFSDAKAIADLHADSWQRHYRGAYADSYLDGDVHAERLEVWINRLAEAGHDRYTFVAMSADSLVGFVHVVLDDDPAWGALHDNLHVEYQFKRKGIGRALMREAAHRLVQSGRQRFYLWVLDQNVAAQKFYAAQGGTRVETCPRGPFPGGGHALGHRIAWPDARVLLK
jgi:ribosomal protein S18 acetylase RimI-like enzyme